MAQGKIKVKTTLPKNVKNKKKTNKGPSATKRANRPIVPKKKKFEEAHKIKKLITKTVNEKIEQEMRTRAGNSKKNLSKVEQAVVTYNTRKQKAN